MFEARERRSPVQLFRNAFAFRVDVLLKALRLRGHECTPEDVARELRTVWHMERAFDALAEAFPARPTGADGEESAVAMVLDPTASRATRVQPATEDGLPDPNTDEPRRRGLVGVMSRFRGLGKPR